MIAYLIYSAPKDAGGQLVADYSNRVHDLTFATNNRGMAECNGTVPLDMARAFLLYDRAGLPTVYVVDTAANTAFEGRLEDVSIVDGGVRLGAYGYARALDDLPYTAMWSVTKLDDFLPTWTFGGGSPDRNRKWAIDAANGTINIGLVKNTIYAGAIGQERGEMYYQIPYNSGRNIVGVMCTTEFLASANITLRISSYDVNYNLVTNHTALVGNGSAQINGRFIATNTPIIAFGLESTTAQTYTGETGDEYLLVSQIRLVTTSTNNISTTLTAARTNGAGVTLTVGSTARMYVGQIIYLNGGAKSELITVTSVTDATHFVATVTLAPGGGYPIGTLVQAPVVYADEIAKDMLSTVRATNSSQLSSATALIQSPGLDLIDEVYNDRSMSDILDYLAALGDNAATPRQWEWGTEVGRALYFRPQSVSNNTWYVDVSNLTIDRSLDRLTNSWYATYKATNGQLLRTSATQDAPSAARYGLTRQQALAADTTSSTLAATKAAAALADSKDPKSRSGLTLTRVYDAAGCRWPLWYVQAGDTIVLRNLPPTLSTTIDKIRVFRLSRAEYRAADDALAIEPDVPTPQLDTLIARLAVAQQQQRQTAAYGRVIVG